MLSCNSLCVPVNAGDDQIVVLFALAYQALAV